MNGSIMRLVLAAIIIAMFVPATAFGETNRHKYLVLHAKVEKEHGKKAAGRNAVHQGLKRKDGSVREIRQSDYRRLLPQLRRLLAPAPRYLNTTASAPAQPPAGTATAVPRVTGAPLAAIRACESGGNYSAIGGGGAYRGAYQFDQQTWNSVGGSGDPAAASPAEQDRRAAMLYSRRGSAPWPVCGR